MRSVAEPELRQPVQHHAGQPGHDARVGQPSVRLAVRRRRAAGDSPAPLGGRRVQPPVVEQLLRDGQSGDWSRRLRPLHDHRTDLRQPERGTAHGRAAAHVPEAERPQPDWRDENYYWQGVDFTANSRMRNGLVLQGGFSTGAGHRDLCDVWAALPELVTPIAPAIPQQVSACKIDEEWQMNWRGLV